MLSDGEASGQRCIYHGLRAKTKFRCALRIVDKLKCWLIVQNSNNSSYDSRVLNENWGGESDGESEAGSNSKIFTITNQNFDVTRNIEVKK